MHLRQRSFRLAPWSRGLALVLTAVCSNAQAVGRPNASPEPAQSISSHETSAPHAVASPGETRPVRRPAQMASAPRTRSRPSYGEMVRKWHAPPTLPAPRTADGRPLLVLEMLNTSERLELEPLGDEGGFSPADIDRASHALRDPRADDEHTIDMRVLDLAYRVQRHFGARSVRVLSAFRVPHGRSNHGRGRALDLVIPGTSDDDVARFARTIGFVGVGLYPRSGFVHVDSRARSYFWIDASGPGQRGRQRPVLGRLAAQSDAKALAQGEAPPAEETNNDDGDTSPPTSVTP